jgi:hypothetical protein
VRPVPLEIHIQALDIANLEARMQAMARPAYSAVAARARGGRPAILFVPTRKHARLTALDLLTYAAADGQPRRFLQARRPAPAPCSTETAGRRRLCSEGVGQGRDERCRLYAACTSRHAAGQRCAASACR